MGQNCESMFLHHSFEHMSKMWKNAKGGKLLHLACRHLISELILASSSASTMFRNTQALKYILVSKNTGLRLIGQDIVQLWKMTVRQLSLHPGRTVSLHLQSLNRRNLNLGMITESYWNSQSSSLDVSLHGEYVSGIQVRYIVLAGWREPFIP